MDCTATADNSTTTFVLAVSFLNVVVGITPVGLAAEIATDFLFLLLMSLLMLLLNKFYTFFASDFRCQFCCETQAE